MKSRRTTRPLVALATYEALPHLAADDRALASALEDRGADCVAAVWDSRVEQWERYDAVLLRSCWDYHLKPRAFAGWLQRLEAAPVALWNPVATVRWSMDKSYLRALAAAGTGVPETVWISKGSPLTLSSLAERGWKQAVVKPTVSAGGYNTHVVDAENRDGLRRVLENVTRHGDALVQPLLPEIVRDGEWSLCFVGGEFSHSVLKRPAAGDFRVQPEFGGTAVAADAPPVARAAASVLLDRLRVPWLYARVDGVVREHRFLLLELELIEPSLFLDASADAPARLADALLCQLGVGLLGLRSSSTARPRHAWRA